MVLTSRVAWGWDGLTFRHSHTVSVGRDRPWSGLVKRLPQLPWRHITKLGETRENYGKRALHQWYWLHDVQTGIMPTVNDCHHLSILHDNPGDYICRQWCSDIIHVRHISIFGPCTCWTKANVQKVSRNEWIRENPSKGWTFRFPWLFLLVPPIVAPFQPSGFRQCRHINFTASNWVKYWVLYLFEDCSAVSSILCRDAGWRRHHRGPAAANHLQNKVTLFFTFIYYI